MPNALATDGSARAVGGRAVVGDPACPCCEGCALGWRQAAECDVSLDCGPFERQILYFCVGTVRCTSGEPLETRLVFFVMDRCWTVTNDPPVAEPPPGALVLRDTPTVLCVPACQADPCPASVFFRLVRSCSPRLPNFYVCGSYRCMVKRYLGPSGGCYIFDPLAPGYTRDQLPGNAIIKTIADFGLEVDSCCAEGCTGPDCVRVDNRIEDPGDDSDCFNQVQPCCCARGEDGFTTGRIRVVQWETEQTITRGAFTPACVTNIRVFVDGLPTIDEFGCARYPVRSIRTSEDRCDGNLEVFGCCISGGCFGCGGWRSVAPRLLGAPGFGQSIVGTQGFEWGVACHAFNPPYGSVLLWSSSATCFGIAQTAVYRYYDPQSLTEIITRFTFVATVQGGRECADCGNGGLRGRGVPGSPPDGPGAAPGGPTGLGDLIG